MRNFSCFFLLFCKFSRLCRQEKLSPAAFTSNNSRRKFHSFFRIHLWSKTGNRDQILTVISIDFRAPSSPASCPLVFSLDAVLIRFWPLPKMHSRGQIEWIIIKMLKFYCPKVPKGILIWATEMTYVSAMKMNECANARRILQDCGFSPPFYQFFGRFKGHFCYLLRIDKLICFLGALERSLFFTIFLFLCRTKTFPLG